MFGFGDHGVSDHGHAHGHSDACMNAVDAHHHAMHSLADNVGHFFNSNLHGDHGNVYSSPSSIGDVMKSGIDAYGASQEMNALCGSGQ
jgi:hypothetical protein